MAVKKETTKDALRKRKREYYLANIEKERERARSRARRWSLLWFLDALFCLNFGRINASATPEELNRRKAQHREAQARYRDKNRQKLKDYAWQRRLEKKRHSGQADDEDEYQRLMAMELDDA
ncbi:hypothetical protein GALMADRAFT_141063 [Galerina marginata CBS 339.88]|uniref:BZIP domain-containing protein n=1 Tax=Galerina marginata (strain CBS 339.88) TaxID=685588 RepID=A0A067SXC9_GALM3|nr:hypothetical protein GALMADRAFT_141063 [Galerina marginata CBS 339.88]